MRKSNLELSVITNILENFLCLYSTIPLQYSILDFVRTRNTNYGTCMEIFYKHANSGTNLKIKIIILMIIIKLLLVFTGLSHKFSAKLVNQ